MNKRVIFILFLFLVLCAGCAGMPVGRTETLTERVNQYWGYLIKNDFEKSYLYESPEYRQGVTALGYAKSFGGGVTWLDARVDKIEEKGDEAVVHVEIRYFWNMALVMPKDGMKSTALENWKFVEGVWYHQRFITSDPLLSPKGGGS